MSHDTNLCPFCMREMDTSTDQANDQDGHATLIQALETIILALGAAKVLATAMKARHDEEGEPQ